MLKDFSPLAVVSLLAMGACVVDAEEGVGSFRAADTVYLTGTRAVTEGTGYQTLVSHQFTFGSSDIGKAIYLAAYGDPTSNYGLKSLDKIRIHCGTPYVNSTENHLTTLAEWQRARLLVSPTSAGTYTCDFEAGVDDVNERAETIVHVYDSDTNLAHSVLIAAGDWWRWGTENDAFLEDCDGEVGGERCTFVGPHSPNAGTEEYVLRSPRFEVPSSAATVDVYSEVELTTCQTADDVEYGSGNQCDDEREGGNSDIELELQLLVQQMCSSTSSTVGAVTTYPSSGNLAFSLDLDKRHKKAHLVAYDVGFRGANQCPSCPGSDCVGRSFKVKTLVQWNSGADVQVNYGDQGLKGYSTGFAFANH